MAKLRVDKIAAPIIKDEYTGSVYFDGDGDYLSISYTTSFDFDFGAVDFTVEAFVLTTDTTTNYPSVVGRWQSAGNACWDFRPQTTDASDNFSFVYSTDGTTPVIVSSGVNICDGKWHHIAASRKGGDLYLFVDGTLKTTHSIGTSAIFDSASAPLYIGYDPYGSSYYNGYTSNLRICKGHAVYTGNFTVPTRELEVHTGAKGVVFPAADNRTVLLACQDAYNQLTEATGRHKITGAGNLGGVPGQELVENGDFASSLDNWTASGIQFSHTTNNVGGNTSGKLMYYATGTNTTRNIYQDVPTVSGARYVLSFDSSSDTASANTIDIAGTSVYTLGDNNNSKLDRTEVGFTASSSTTRITFTSTVSNRAYLDNVSVVAVPPISEANPGLLRKTNTTSTITETTGSVYFDGTGDYFSVGNASDADWAFGTDPFTVEHWIYWQSVGNGQLLSPGMGNETNAWYWQYYNSQLQWGAQGVASDLTYSFTPNANRWYHIAVSRDYSQKMRFFIDGVEVASGTVSRNYVASASPLLIANGGAGNFQGYMSNVRVCKGHAVYTSNFIPPTRELEVHEGPDDDRTVLLCCYDGENIFADKTGRHIIAVYGDRPSSTTWTSTDTPVGSTTVTPGLIREVDPTEGPTFGGGAGFVSQNWLTLPKGTTEQRSRGRGLVGGGYITNYTNTIEYIEIHTLGNGQDFGDLSIAKAFVSTNSSSTRCVFSGGYAPSASRSEIEYVNISTTGNVTNFGTTISSSHSRAACGSNTRGIIASGSASNIIEYITFSTLGNSKDFGDYGIGRHRDHSGCSSPTRGIFAGGFTPTNTNSIQYVTISTVGNSQDFGDLSSARGLGTGAASSATRGVFFGGSVYPSTSGTNIIEYITISTQGNTTDFGDLTRSSYRMPCTSNGTRAVAYTSSPSPGGNAIEYVTIATTGNASDFGDSLINAREYSDSASSDSHGGIS